MFSLNILLRAAIPKKTLVVWPMGARDQHGQDVIRPSVHFTLPDEEKERKSARSEKEEDINDTGTDLPQERSRDNAAQQQRDILKDSRRLLHQLRKLEKYRITDLVDPKVKAHHHHHRHHHQDAVEAVECSKTKLGDFNEQRNNHHHHHHHHHRHHSDASEPRHIKGKILPCSVNDCDAIPRHETNALEQDKAGGQIDRLKSEVDALIRVCSHGGGEGEGAPRNFLHYIVFL